MQVRRFIDKKLNIRFREPYTHWERKEAMRAFLTPKPEREKHLSTNWQITKYFGIIDRTLYDWKKKFVKLNGGSATINPVTFDIVIDNLKLGHVESDRLLLEVADAALVMLLALQDGKHGSGVDRGYSISSNPITRAVGSFCCISLIRNLHKRKRSRDEVAALKVSKREQLEERKETKLRNEVYPILRLWEENVESLDRNATSFAVDSMKYLTENVSGEMLNSFVNSLNVNKERPVREDTGKVDMRQKATKKILLDKGIDILLAKAIPNIGALQPTTALIVENTEEGDIIYSSDDDHADSVMFF
jgi:hypothetical protein